MANIREPLINVVNGDKPKVLGCFETRNSRAPQGLTGLGQKGKGSGIGVPNSPIADGIPPAERRSLTHAVKVLARNVVSP
jgi:hypothetical protein